MLGAQVFFYNLGNELLNNTMDYLIQEGMKDSQAKKILDENGVGIKAFMQSLEDNFVNLKLQLN